MRPPFKLFPLPPPNKRDAMINVSSWSIRNPIPAVMLFVLLTFGGLLSFNVLFPTDEPSIPRLMG